MSTSLETSDPYPLVRPAAATAGGSVSAPLRLARRAGECVPKVVASLATGYFAAKASAAYVAQPGRIALLCVLLSEALTLALILLSSAPKRRDWHVLSVACACYVYVYSALLDTDPGLSVVPDGLVVVPAAFAAAGFGLMMWAKLALGSSFGLLPGVRTIVMSGPYRFIRHPIYTGFFMTDIAYILSDYNERNTFVIASVAACQFYRIMREEALLRTEASYAEYSRRVPYRFIPGIA